MHKRGKGSRTAQLVGATILGTVSASVPIIALNATPASADYTGPPGCSVSADDSSSSWANVCYTGNGYWTDNRTMPDGVGVILEQLFYGSGLGCTWGSPSDSALRSFQYQNGLTVDGIAGPQTYGRLQSTLAFDGTSLQVGPYGPVEWNYYTAGGLTAFKKWIFGYGTPADQWFVSFGAVDGPWKYLGEYSC